MRVAGDADQLPVVFAEVYAYDAIGNLTCFLESF
jgi:hypothetical protein